MRQLSDMGNPRRLMIMASVHMNPAIRTLVDGSNGASPTGKKMTGYTYTAKEDAILKEWYEKEGLPGAMVKLQLAGFSRTANSVRRRASILKLKSPYCSANFGPGPYTPDPKFDLAFNKASALISEGVKVGDACRMAGIERSRYYRTRKVRDNFLTLQDQCRGDKL
jgi:hypothetical protein